VVARGSVGCYKETIGWQRAVKAMIWAQMQGAAAGRGFSWNWPMRVEIEDRGAVVGWGFASAGRPRR
jgi:hypothetical protein